MVIMISQDQEITENKLQVPLEIGFTYSLCICSTLFTS